MSSSKEVMYKKRPGTSGMSGQLYKTKLISLILFRLLHDERYEHFYLASNIDEIGSFDDVCFKAKIKGLDRPVLVFLQIKHKDKDNSLVDFEDVKHFHDSYSKVVESFHTNSKDREVIFEGKFEENECIFVLYTNGRYNHDSGVNFESPYASTLNELLATGKNGAQLEFTEQIVEESAEAIIKKEMMTLAEHITKFLNCKSNETMGIMFDDYILRYHVILAKNVFDVSEIQSDEEKPDLNWRDIRFRECFFESNDKYLLLLRKAIYKCALQYRVTIEEEDSIIEERIRTFYENPCATTLSPLIGSHIENKDGKLVFISQKSQDKIQKLKQINLSEKVIEEAEAIAARIILNVELKVPVTFGNTDLIISETRMDDLTESIVNLCNKFELINSYKVVKMDEIAEDGLLCVNGGLPAAVGNLLVYDEDTKLLKFTDHCSFQEKNAHIILNKLKSKMSGLDEYRFDVKKSLPFPKLSFDSNAVAKDILHKVVVYSLQSDHNTVETILKKQMQDYHNSIASLTHIQPASMFLNYHGEVLDWWLSKNHYLTKDTKIYQRAINNIAIEPQINSLKYTFLITKIYKDIKFTTESLQSLERLSIEKPDKEKNVLDKIRIIVTDVTTLTTMKVVQYLKSKDNNKYAIMDLETTVNLSSDDFCALKQELRNTDKIIIIICDNLASGITWYEKYLKEIAHVVKKKKTIVITNNIYVTMIQNAFSLSMKIKEDINEEIEDEILIYAKHNLTDLIPELQKSILKTYKILFQGKLINLDLFLDETSLAYVEETVLDKIISNKTGEIQIGNLLSNPDYEEIRHLYQDRVVEYVTSHLVPGKVCVSNGQSTLDEFNTLSDHAESISEEDDFFYINLLKDCNKNNSTDIGNKNEHPSCIIYTFVCHLNPKKIAESTDAINIILQVKRNEEPYTISNRLVIKKKNILNRFWSVEIKLYSRQFREWQRNGTAFEDVLNTLKYMCRGALICHIIGDEIVEIRSVVGDIDKETMNYLFMNEGRNYFWCEGNPVDFTISETIQKYPSSKEGCNYFWTENNATNVNVSESLPKDTVNNIASSSKVKTRPILSNSVTLNTMQEDIGNDGITAMEQKASSSNCTTEDVPKDFEVMTNSLHDYSKVKTNYYEADDSSKDELPTPVIDFAKIKLPEYLQTGIDHNIRSDVRPDYINYLHSVYADNYFSLIPDISILINDEQEDVDRNKNTLEHLNNEVFMSESKAKNVHKFNLRFLCKHRMHLRSFDDIKDDVVLLTAKPGVGKSTLLTHLSQKCNNNLWILKVNLIDCSGQFNKWQNDKSIVIDILKILNLMFKVILNNKKIAIKLKETCSKVHLECCSGDDWDNFHLNMFLHYFNQGKLLFLFDGFDEICPDYKDEVIEFLKVIKNDTRNNKMWITSRPYNLILPDLEQHFGRTYKIDYFDKTNQKQFLKNFWDGRHSRPFNSYNSQLIIYYMSKIISILDDKLKMICYNFYDYLVTKYELREPLNKMPKMKLYIKEIEEVYRVLDAVVLSNAKSGVYEFLGTPLLLNLAAGFFESEVLNIAKISKKGHLVYNIVTMYQWCIETKLRDIFFQNKCGIDTDMPLAKETYYQQLKERINLHKRLGAHAIFGSPLFKNKRLYFEEFKDLAPFNIDDENGRKEFDDIIDTIRHGKEINGLISYVTDDGTPIFVHKTFAEYFAYDYICDILKSDMVEYDTKKLLLTVILTIMHTEIIRDERGRLLSTRGISTWVQERGRIDEELEKIGRGILSNHPLIGKYVAFHSNEKSSMLRHVYIRLMNSTSDDYDEASDVEENIEDYLSGRREVDPELFKMMKPHYKKKFPPFSNDIQYC